MKCYNQIKQKNVADLLSILKDMPLDSDIVLEWHGMVPRKHVKTGLKTVKLETWPVIKIGLGMSIPSKTVVVLGADNRRP